MKFWNFGTNQLQSYHFQYSGKMRIVLNVKTRRIDKLT